MWLVSIATIQALCHVRVVEYCGYFLKMVGMFAWHTQNLTISSKNKAGRHFRSINKTSNAGQNRPNPFLNLKGMQVNLESPWREISAVLNQFSFSVSTCQYLLLDSNVYKSFSVPASTKICPWTGWAKSSRAACSQMVVVDEKAFSVFSRYEFDCWSSFWFDRLGEVHEKHSI